MCTSVHNTLTSIKPIINEAGCKSFLNALGKSINLNNNIHVSRVKALLIHDCRRDTEHSLIQMLSKIPFPFINWFSLDLIQSLFPCNYLDMTSALYCVQCMLSEHTYSIFYVHCFSSNICFDVAIFPPS